MPAAPRPASTLTTAQDRARERELQEAKAKVDAMLDVYQPLPRRLRRLVLPALALATALLLFYLMLERPGAQLHLPMPPRDSTAVAEPAMPDQARCPPGQTRDCVGGRAEVFVLPAR